MTIDPDIDWPSEEVQYKQLEFWDKLQRCYLCDESWFNKYIKGVWYIEFNKWVTLGKCSRLKSGLGHF